MSYRKEVTIEMLREMIDYNPETGDMVWKEREGRARARAKAGQPVGCPRPPYRTVTIYRNKLYVHRIAFALTHGRWPEPFCDHINGDPSDNRACNLREATHLESAHNIRGHKRSRSGVKGVHWHPPSSPTREEKTMKTDNTTAPAVGCSALFDTLQPWQKEMIRRAVSGDAIKIGCKGRHGRSVEESALKLATEKVNEISEKIHDTEVLLGSLTVALKEWTYIRDDLSNRRTSAGVCAYPTTGGTDTSDHSTR